MGIVEIYWKYIDKSIYKIWGRFEVIWTSFVSKFVIKSSSIKFLRHKYQTCITHVSHTYVYMWYTIDINMIHMSYTNDTQCDTHIIFFSCSVFTSNFQFTTSKLHQIIPKLWFNLLKLCPIYSNSKQSNN